MEKLLEKIARQLDSIDEASLMALWSKYATITSRFEPTKRWEESCLIFSLIQAKHFKNQLWNYCWKQATRVQRPDLDVSAPEFDLERPEVKMPPQPEGAACRVLSFTPERTESPVTEEGKPRGRKRDAAKGPDNKKPDNDD